jgi:hypothetical protein
VLLVRRIVVARGAEQDSGELVALIEQLIKSLLELSVAYGQGTISVPLGPLRADRAARRSSSLKNDAVTPSVLATIGSVSARSTSRLPR